MAPAKSKREAARPLFETDAHETAVDEGVLFAFLRRRGFVHGAWATASAELRAEVHILADLITAELGELGTNLKFPRDESHPVRQFAYAIFPGLPREHRWLLEMADCFIEGRPLPSPKPVPLPLILFCPICHERHIDVAEFATKVHHTHSCQHCGFTWRPAVEPTVGVQFLPGFKNT